MNMRVNPGIDPSRADGLVKLMWEHSELLDDYAVRQSVPPAAQPSYVDAKAAPSTGLPPGRRPSWAQSPRSVGQTVPLAPSKAALTRVNHAGEQDLPATVFLNGVSGYVPPIPRDDPQEAPLKTEKTRQATVSDMERDERRKAAKRPNYTPAAGSHMPNQARYQLLQRSRAILNLGLPEIYLGMRLQIG